MIGAPKPADRILRAMRRLDEATFVALRDATGIATGSLQSTLERLCKAGVLTRCDTTNTGRRWVYSVAVAQ